MGTLSWRVEGRGRDFEMRGRDERKRRKSCLLILIKQTPVVVIKN